MALASFNKGATLIALRALPALAGRSFAPADVVPWLDLGLKERTVAQLISQRRLGELSQDNFNYALKQRHDGDIPAGFTEDGLTALGISLPAAPAAPAAPDLVLAYDSEEVRGPYVIKGRKFGKGMRYDVFAQDGGRLNPGGQLASLKTVDGFIAHLEAETARIAAGAETAAEAQAKAQVAAEQDSPDTQQPEAGQGGGDPAAPAVEGAEGYGDEAG